MTRLYNFSPVDRCTQSSERVRSHWKKLQVIAMPRWLIM